MDAVTSLLNVSFNQFDQNYMPVFAGALAASDCIEKDMVYVISNAGNGSSAVEVISHCDYGSDRGVRGLCARLKIGSFLDVAKKLTDLNYIYVKLEDDTQDNVMTLSYKVDDNTNFKEFACWLDKRMKQFGLLCCSSDLLKRK